MYIMTYPEHHDPWTAIHSKIIPSFPVLGADPTGHILPGLRLIQEHRWISAQLRVQVGVKPLRLHRICRALRQNGELGTPSCVVSSKEDMSGMVNEYTYESYEIIWDYHRLSLWVTHLLIGGTMHIILISTDTEWKQPWFGDVAVNFQYWDWSHLILQRLPPDRCIWIWVGMSWANYDHDLYVCSEV